MTEQAAQGQAPTEGMGPAPKAPSKAGGAVKRIVIYVVVAAVVGLGGLAWKYLSGDPTVATVGDCLIEAVDANDMKIVECTDATAAHKVVGKVEGKTEAEFMASDDVCAAYPTAENGLWSGKPGAKGDVLCLEPVKK